MVLIIETKKLCVAIGNNALHLAWSACDRKKERGVGGMCNNNIILVHVIIYHNIITLKNML